MDLFRGHRSGCGRALWAAAFLFIVLAEWGSHAVICSDESHGGTLSMSAAESGHEDPCQTLVLCSDNRQKDQQTLKLGHDASQHNALFDLLPRLGSQVEYLSKTLIPFETGEAVFRPPQPPFHPPKSA